MVQYCLDSKCQIKDDKELEVIRQVAEQGNVEAQYKIGLYYENETPKNYPEAIKWYRRAAEKGHADAQYHLACCYYQYEVVDLYRKSAEQGYPEAQYRLAQCLENSSFSFETTESGEWERNEAEAYKWYLKAAEQGCIDAQRGLSNCYELGHGVKKDPAKALELDIKVAESGDRDMQFFLGRSYLK